MPRPAIRKGRGFTTVSVDGDLFEKIKKVRHRYPTLKSDNDALHKIVDGYVDELYGVSKKDRKQDGW